MSELGIFYPSVPSEVKTETFTGTIEFPFGDDTPIEKIREIARLLRNKHACVIITFPVGDRDLDVWATYDAGRDDDTIVFQFIGNADGGKVACTFIYYIGSTTINFMKQIFLLKVDDTYADITEVYPLPASITTTVQTW